MTVFQINKQGLRVADNIASFPHEAGINPYGSGFCPESNHVWFNFITLLEPKTYKHLSMNGFYSLSNPSDISNSGYFDIIILLYMMYICA